MSLSSAESEYYSMVRCASEAIGLATTIRKLGHEAQVRIWTDAAERHADWLSEAGAAQSRIWKRSTFGCNRKRNQELTIEKIRGTVNPADLMTKHLDGKRLVTLCELLNIRRIDGRPSSAPKLTSDTDGKASNIE